MPHVLGMVYHTYNMSLEGNEYRCVDSTKKLNLSGFIKYLIPCHSFVICLGSLETLLLVLMSYFYRSLLIY